MDRDSILTALRDPTRAWIVILIGLVLIYREFNAPGRVLPGVFGGVAACVGVYSSVPPSVAWRSARDDSEQVWLSSYPGFREMAVDSPDRRAPA